MHPFGEKAKAFIKRHPAEDAFINILQGAIRSGKTWAMIPKLLILNKYKVAGLRVIVGVSKQTVYDNILSDLFDFIGTKNYVFNRQSGELWIYGVKWLVIGAKDEGSEKYLRGKTIGIAYVDEATLIPKSSFDMLISRMSPEGARLYCTTNPDTPYHYLKTDYLENKELLKAGDIWTELFVLDDNLSLSEAKKAQYRRMYSGVFYQRFILGRWVIAEGAIYKDVLGPAEYDDTTRPPGLYSAYQARYVAIDYGTTNPCVFLDVFQYQNVFWEDREYRWDSRKEMRQKTDQEYADDLENFLFGEASPCKDKRGVILVIDPSAASFKVECVKRGFLVKDAKNDVLEGIRRTMAALATGKYRYHKRNVHTNKEMSTYAWDPKAAKRGEETPIKENDHGPDARRYCIHTCMPAWMVG